MNYHKKDPIRPKTKILIRIETAVKDDRIIVSILILSIEASFAVVIVKREFTTQSRDHLLDL